MRQGLQSALGSARANLIWRAGRRRVVERPPQCLQIRRGDGQVFSSTRVRVQEDRGQSSSSSSSSSTPAPPEESEFSHRAIGKAQGLFLSLPDSPGTPFVLPHGVRLARKLERVVRDLYDVHGYNEVISPQLYKKDLWVRSGHWENYRDDMFGVEGFLESDQRQQEAAMAASADRGHVCSAHGHGNSHAASSSSESAFGLKPMNCPGHCLIFASTPKTIKDLPIRFAEFSPLHRNEASGALSGLTRVRRFHQDDAHVFCAPSQVKQEINSMLVMLQNAYNLFGFPQFELALSTRPDSYIGSLDEWANAERQLQDALESSGLSWTMNEGDGAFYGPKIDVRLIDAMGRRHQTATIQLDFQLPQRFDLHYDDAGQPARPVMIHRAILGSVERFMAILIESRRGNWPFWINPRQAVVVPVTNQNKDLVEYAERVKTHLALGQDFVDYARELASPSSSSASRLPPPRPTQVFHVDVDASEERFQKRIRTASTVTKHSFALVVGEEEMRDGTVNVRFRGLGSVGGEASAAAAPATKSKKQLLREKKLREREQAERSEEAEASAMTASPSPSSSSASPPPPPPARDLEEHRQIRLEQARLHDVLQGQNLGAWKVQDVRELFEKMDRWHL